MKIAVPVWNDSVSNVFDFAGRLLLVELDNGKELSRSEVPLRVQSLPERAGGLKQLGVNVLLCGAISRALANMVTASGIEVLPYVTGRVEEVLQAYLTGQLINPRFTMPGCWPGARKGFGRCRRGGHGRRWYGLHEKF
jgi:predicted Fe-Mo cluster-binding NifX family protein